MRVIKDINFFEIHYNNLYLTIFGRNSISRLLRDHVIYAGIAMRSLPLISAFLKDKRCSSPQKGQLVCVKGFHTTYS